MERKFQCPSCGAANVVTNPGVLMKVCDFCRTAIYWDKESALRAGRKSMDLPESSRFRVGATGRISGRSFTVLGRLSYAHGQGSWDEWFIEMRDGKILWLAEDEGELFLETPLELTSPVPHHGDLVPGMQIHLNEKIAVVEEIGEARCLGGEGQIPFEVEVGETYPYADGTAADGSFIFGLEYDVESGVPRAFTGKALSTADSKAAAGAGREAPARTGESIRCPSCAKPYEGPRVESTEMVVCQACGSGLRLDEAELRVVGRNPRKKPRFTFKVGTPINLENTPYEVMGRLYYVEVDEGIEYPSFEYILYNPEKGYLWLSEEDGHFTTSQPIHLRVNVRSVRPKKKVKVGPDEFRIFEGGTVALRWVDGALPWTAAIGEKTRYVHMIKPPEYVDREITGGEMELFRGRYVAHDEMLSAIPKGVKLPGARGVYSCQPYVPSPWLWGTGVIGAAFLLLNILLLIFSLTEEKAAVVLKQQITADQYMQEYLSPPFNVPHDGCILRLSGSAPLRNSWVALDFALVDAGDRVINEFWDEASFYHGRDAEGYWSEGSGRFGTNFKVEKAGDYRLLVHAAGGSGYRGPPRKEPINVVIRSDVTMSYYFTLPIILSAICAAAGPLSRSAFEARRWAPVMDYGD